MSSSSTVTTAVPVIGKESSREGSAEITTGARECFKRILELTKSIGFPTTLPLRQLVECGLVRDTGFVWMKQKKPYEHYFRATGTWVRYETEVTAFVEEGRIKRMNGMKSKQLLMWVPIVEMRLDGDARDWIYFKSSIGIGRSFPASVFADEVAAAEAFANEADTDLANDR
uniref:DUF538 domain-containing protein n=1 Tax=Leersia perrieri TaxID=77586 RepID=A0A0D9XLK5_9ORYZ